MADEPRSGPRRQWHIGKEIPIALLIAVAVQTGGWIWWAASISARLDNLKETATAAVILQAAVDRRQDEEAQRSEARILANLDRVNQKLDRLIETKK